jgi:hypothetical protein
MSDLIEGLQAARESYVREDYAANVKRLFREHFEALEPDAEIEDTLYFNHSAIPDFKLTWGRGASGKSSRDVFLRSSYAAVVAGNETTQITTGDPVFLSISADQTVEEPGFSMTTADVARVANQARYALLTDAAAFREMAAPVGDLNPLSAIVRSNFMRGGRGLVDEPIAEQLRAKTQDTDGNVTDLIRENFFEDAVFRMERTAQLVQWALSPTTGVDQPKGDGFWKALGSLFSLEQLEDLAPELDGVDLTSLLQANLTVWSARRAYLGLNIPPESLAAEQVDEEDGAVQQVNAETDSQTRPTSEAPDAWRFDSGTLAFLHGPFAVRVGNSGYKLKARPGSSTPKWTDTGDRLDEYAVRSVSVAGIERAFRVDAKESSNIKDDVDKVVESVEDTYFVSHVEVMLPGPPEDAGTEVDLRPVVVDFAGGIAIADGPVQVGSLVRVATNIMGKRQLDDELAEPQSEGTEGVDE